MRITIFLWSTFWIYWVISGIVTRSRVKKESNGQENTGRIVHLISVLSAFVITFFQIDFFLINKNILPQSLTIDYLGIVILLLSLSFAIWARVILGKNWSGAIQKVEGQKLVRKGPYRYIRNPIYTGIILGFFATFMIIGTIASLLGFFIVLTTYIVKINKEQKFLVTEFGEKYKEYIRESWALIPYIF